MSPHALNLIVSVSQNWGIGKCGGLPWKLKKDMAFFKSITTAAENGKQNAVIMGRKTWDSIPNKFKPLNNRTNIIVSSTLTKPSSDDYFVVPSLIEALNLLGIGQLNTITDKIFVIGGAQLYKEALDQTAYPVRIYCTHVFHDFDCDVYFPQVDWSKMKTVQLPEVPSDVIEENGYSYKFCVYDRV